MPRAPSSCSLSAVWAAKRDASRSSASRLARVRWFFSACTRSWKARQPPGSPFCLAASSADMAWHSHIEYNSIATCMLLPLWQGNRSCIWHFQGVQCHSAAGPGCQCRRSADQQKSSIRCFAACGPRISQKTITGAHRPCRMTRALKMIAHLRFGPAQAAKGGFTDIWQV